MGRVVSPKMLYNSSAVFPHTWSVAWPKRTYQLQRMNWPCPPQHQRCIEFLFLLINILATDLGGLFSVQRSVRRQAEIVKK